MVLAGSLMVRKLVFESRYDVSGHAAGHLSSATAGLLSVVFPPWIIPGAGVVVLVVARCIAEARSLKQSAMTTGEAPTPST